MTATTKQLRVAALAAAILSLAARAAPPDAGPTYGKDFSGMDYNVTPWHSDASKSADHWRAAALECEALCVADPACCTWTYCTPEAGASDPERCCLKGAIPAEVPAATHWTGAPKGATQQCLHPPPPPPPPYPGPPWLAPHVTNRPPCVQVPNWHDVAGALVAADGSFHVFQGTGSCGGVPAGWHHAVSSNLVDWLNMGIEPTLSATAEPYGTSSPCSGFMVRDDDGVPCAGFRECGGQEPGRNNTRVPLELRCALDAHGAATLTNFSAPIYLFEFIFNRNLPYDPVRPWKDTDGRWYAVVSADACNSTVPCAGGGALYLYSSPKLRGPGANWQPSASTPIMFSSNFTVLTPQDPTAVESNEFVTSGYFGNLPGDPRGGTTRCFTNNVFNSGLGGTTAFFCGTQAAGGPLIVDEASPFSRGMIDWGSFSVHNESNRGVAALAGNGRGPFKMARTLSPSSANQVLDAGRKVMSAWLDGGGMGQANSLPRDLSLDAETGELLQQFSPELQALRTGGGAPEGLRSAQVEVVATFTVAAGADPQAEFGVAVWQSEDGADETRVSALLGPQLVRAAAAAGPLQPQIAAGAAGTVRLHIIADRSVLSVIANNRTAVTAFVAPRDADSTRVAVFGVDGTTVTVEWQAWALRDAVINNTAAV
jgi:hypothetical protein